MWNASFSEVEGPLTSAPEANAVVTHPKRIDTESTSARKTPTDLNETHSFHDLGDKPYITSVWDFVNQVGAETQDPKCRIAFSQRMLVSKARGSVNQAAGAGK